MIREQRIFEVENPALEVHNLSVSYDKKPVLWNIDLTVPKGCLIGIIGPNGAGKSSLLKSVMGILNPSAGHIKIFGTSISKIRDRISYVPQRETIDWNFPVSVKDVVMMGRYGKVGLFKRFSEKDKTIVSECLKKVNLHNMSNTHINSLSGGQQQRVFIARSLAQEADIYFMDEPFSGVDITTEQNIISLLRKESDNGKTILVVHHNLQSASQYFDWIILLNMQLIASGPTDKVLVKKLVEKAYGGKLSLLSQMTEIVHRRQFPL